MTYTNVSINNFLGIKQDFFTYQCPPDLESKIKLGQLILVPFGKQNLRAIIIDITSQKPDIKKVRQLTKIIDEQPLLTDAQIKLAIWMANYYACPLLKIIKLMLPQQIWQNTYKPKLEITYRLSKKTYIKKDFNRAKKQLNFLQFIQSQPNQTVSHNSIPSLFSTTIINALIKKKLIIKKKTILKHSIANDYNQQQSTNLKLTKEQATALKTINSSDKKITLLHGVTCSGKTEIYLQAIEKILKENKQVIMLVPEIALTPQTINRFNNRFPNLIAVIHSKLSISEKLNEWTRIKNKTAKIVIGSRSAIFAPVQNLGLIIIDEEHETTYQQEQQPRYHAKTVASQYSFLTNCKIILGSATPNIATYHKFKQENLNLITLNQRIGKQSLPTVNIVDMREELKKRNFSIFSEELKLKLALVLEQKQQAILFINRRGVASSILCRECGWIARCPHCEISLTLHSKTFQNPNLICHYCGHQESLPFKCPSCKSVAIKPLGSGTQKVEQELLNLFPSVKILRADRDTTATKNSHQKIFQDFTDQKANILIGTQMIAKGLHLPNVTLVGIILADYGLNYPDFQAGEKVFSLLTQVAGRAGRGNIPGQVILQTYMPENYAIQHACKQDYNSFYNEEITTRKLFNYPPFVKMLKLTFVHPNYDLTQLACQKLNQYFKNFKTKHHISDNLKKQNSLQVNGPIPDIVPKKYGKFHFHFYLKYHNEKIIRDLLIPLKESHWKITRINNSLL